MIWYTVHGTLNITVFIKFSWWMVCCVTNVCECVSELL